MRESAHRCARIDAKKRRGARIESRETDEGGRRMASAWNTKKKSNSAMKEKELGDVTPSRKRTKRMKPAFDAELTDEVRNQNAISGNGRRWKFVMTITQNF